MKKYQPFQYGFLSWIVLTTCAIMAVTTSYQNFNDRFSCGGWYGVGFPVSFLCDHGAGGSPISGWGRIDSTDFPYISLQGILADILFYFVILFVVAWLVRFFVYHKDSHHHEDYKWMVLISIAFIVGFFFSSLMFESNRISFHDYILGITPTAVPSPTPHGTLPSDILPSATPTL